MAGKAALLGHERDGAGTAPATPGANGLHEDTLIRGWERSPTAPRRVSCVRPASERGFQGASTLHVSGKALDSSGANPLPAASKSLALLVKGVFSALYFITFYFKILF